MKYVFCVIAVILEYLVYSMIGVALGWRHGGGFLPMLLLYSAMVQHAVLLSNISTTRKKTLWLQKLMMMKKHNK